MKILLISSNLARTPYPIYPLGAGMVAAALRHAGHDVRLFDWLQNEGSLATLDAEVGRVAPELVGISIRNIDNVNLLHEQRYIDGVRDMVQVIRKAAPRRKILLGGSGFSILPEEILDATGADYGIVGEGEQLVVEFAANAARNEYPPARCIRARPGLQGAQIPSAYYDPSALEFYLQNGHVAAVQTKRGCPHRCLYCSYPVLEGARLRPRDASAVVDDMVHLAGTRGAKLIFFTDSVFNDDENLYLDVIAEMERRCVSVPWTAFFKPAALTDELVLRMKRTGLQAVELGSDAATDATLRGLAKGFTFEQVIRCSDQFTRHGVPVAHYFMFGGPGETPQTVEEGIANVRGLTRAVSFVFMGIRILPDTGLYRLALRDGIVKEGQSLLDPVYYISPQIKQAWLEATLTRGFAGVRNVVFPPDALESTLSFLHKLGYSGSMWELLVGGERRRQRSRSPSASPA